MDHGENRRGFFASRANMVLLVFLGLCIGMHFFMHGGHGGHGSGSDENGPPPGGGREPGDHRH